jgi:SPP1 gp7 family putative phage head morphogenesis protein
VSVAHRFRVATDAPVVSPANPGDLRREFFVGDIPYNEQWRPYFGRSLDLTRIEQAILAANHGRMSYMTDLARETIMLDGHVNSLLQKRLNRLGALDFDVQPAQGTGIDEVRARERAEEVRENIAMIPNFHDRLIDLAWGNFDGRATSELEWFRWGRSWRVRNLHWIHPRRLCFGPDRDIRVQDPMRQTGNFQDVGFPVEAVPYKFVVFKPRMFGDYQEREGLAPRTLYWSFFARLGRREQLELMEIFGKPWRIMKPAANVLIPAGNGGGGNVDVYKAAFDALTQLGWQNTARMPPGVDVQIVQPEQGAGQVHNDVIVDCRQVLTKLYLGGVATTDAVSTGLGSSIGDVHLSEEDLIIATDARRVAECIEDQLTDAIIIANYGPGEVVYAPKFVIRTDPPVDRQQEGLRVKTGLDIGLRIAEEEARDRMGFRALRKDEPYLVRIQRPGEAGQVSPPPAPETVWPPGEAPPSGEIPAAPDLALNLPDGATGLLPGAVRPTAPALPPGAAPPPVPGDPAVPAPTPPKPPTAPGGGVPGGPGDPGHKDDPGGGAGQLTASDDLPDEDIARLAAKMTALGVAQCAHGKTNRCRICGIERVRDVELGADNEPVWSVAWKPIGSTSKPPTVTDTADAANDGAPAPVPGDAALPDDDEEDTTDGGRTATTLSELISPALRRLLNTLGGMPPSEGGTHWHKVDLAAHATEIDGVHTHWFQLPDNSLVESALGGSHQHRWQDHSDGERRSFIWGGAHFHTVPVDGDLPMATQVDASHSHELRVTATAQDGEHSHCLVLPDGATIESLTCRELAEILEGQATGEIVTYRFRMLCRLSGIVLESELASRRGIQLAAQTATTFGSPDDLVTRGTAALARETLAFGESIAERCDGKTTGKALKKAIEAAARAWDRKRFAEPVAAELEHGMWLGALDADFEAQTGGKVQVETFSDLWRDIVLLRKDDPGADVDPAFAKRPQIDAGKAFIEKDVVTRDVFDEMTKSAQRRAFTVANAATEEIARSVKRELVRQVAVGADLRDFKTHALRRLADAGWTPLNASHAETVLRTNVMTAYNSGRYRQMTQPVVKAARPYWQVLGVGDDRQRRPHHEAQNKVLPADDPWFKTAYPPFGYNCRCRTRSLSQAQAEAIGISSASSMPALPDEGFTSGTGHLL